MRHAPLTVDFFEQPTLGLAPALLGQLLVHEAPEGLAVGRIVEVEAYRGPEDKAAHSYGGRRTARTAVMYGPAGHAYVFRIYGMHVCFNVTSGPEGAPEAILVRALQPLCGLALMAARRYGATDATLTPSQRRGLTSGPAKLCQALGITMAHYGHDLRQPPLYLAQGNSIPAAQVGRGPRIHVDYAEEAKDWPWRFWIKGEADVSVKPRD